jgi:hypothetical protein
MNKGDVLIFSVRLVSPDQKTAKFESELRYPFSDKPADQQRAVEQWLDLMATGFRIGASYMQANLGSGGQGAK